MLNEERDLRLKQPSWWQEWGGAVGWLTTLITSLILVAIAWARNSMKINFIEKRQDKADEARGIVTGRVEVLEAQAVVRREAVTEEINQANAVIARELAASNAQIARELAENNARVAKALADSNTHFGERLSALETTAKFQSETMTAHGQSLQQILAATILIQKEGCWRAAEFHEKKA